MSWLLPPSHGRSGHRRQKPRQVVHRITDQPGIFLVHRGCIEGSDSLTGLRPNTGQCLNIVTLQVQDGLLEGDGV
ncbi:hypothetical protein [Xenorhabdus szentirmaii]|uniref:hypothetical protein n=1 Tax=Xenorhabdus szentirmaii TaxID=290112 RepID=UPI0005709116|nr:hypothetical protein [Xenorhabdus szentirmaii]